MVQAVEEVAYVLIGISVVGETFIDKDRGISITHFGGDQQYIKIFGELVLSSCCVIGNNVYWYVNTADVSYTCPQICGYVGGMLTGNMRGLLQFGKTSYYDEMYELGERRIEECISKFTYKYKIDKVREKISQNHHYHVRLKDIFTGVDTMVLHGWEAVLACYLDRFNYVESTHTTFFTYCYALAERERALFLGMCFANNGIHNDWLKAEGRAAKQSTGLADFKFSTLYELNVLVNRLDTPVNWQMEREHRVTPEVTDMTYSQIFKHALTLFNLARLEGKTPLRMSFKEYWAQRAVAMPAGAIHENDKEATELIKTLPREIRNKKGYAACMPDMNENVYISKPPEIHAYTSTKYEWGKSRALYGCDFTSHVNADFGLMACEETFPHFIPTGNNANFEYIKKVMQPFTDKIPFCYDFDDFNSQHSASAMEAVIDAWLAVYYDYLNDEQREAVKWTAKSTHNQYVHDNANGGKYKTNGTLFSGWRLTSFVNTALNYCYLAQAGINKQTSLHMHNGDDVFACVDNLAQAVKLYGDAKRYGIRANMVKMSIGTIAEFLRTDMRAKEDTSMQYLTRGIATFTHSRIESGAPNSYTNLVQSYVTRKTEIEQRGAKMNVIRRLFRRQLFFARRLFNIDKELADKLMSYDSIAGGISKDGVLTNEIIVENSTREGVTQAEELGKWITKGVTAYTTYIASKFPQFRDQVTKRTVEKSILSGFNVKRTTLSVEAADEYELRHKKAMRGAWHDMQGIALINRIRMGVNNIIFIMDNISAEKAVSLSRKRDPVTWLALLLK